MRRWAGEGLTGNIPRLIAALALAVLGGAVFAWLRLPLPWMLGAMTASTAATFAGLRFEMPHALRVPMLGVLGVLLGSGFTTDVAAGMLRWAGSISALPVYIVLSLLAGVTFMRRVMHMDRVTAFFGAAPGGLSEMVLLGERAGGDMRTISLLHGTRVFMIVFCVPFIVRLIEQPGTAVLPRPARRQRCRNSPCWPPPWRSAFGSGRCCGCRRRSCWARCWSAPLPTWRISWTPARRASPSSPRRS